MLVGPEKRWKGHCNSAAFGSTFLFHAAIRKYGTIAWKHETLEIVKTIEAAHIAEIWWITQRNSFAFVPGGWGYNMTRGGEGKCGPMSELQKINIRAGRVNKCTGSVQPMFNGHPRQKLTTQDVIEIKSSPNDVSHHELAKRYNVTFGHICNIRLGRVWKHIRPDLTKQPSVFYKWHNGYTKNTGS